MFGFTIWPVFRSRMRSSNSAKFSDPIDAAVDLALGGEPADDEAAVLDRQHALHLDDAGLDVDGDLGELHARGRHRRQPGLPVAVDRRSAAVPSCLHASAHDRPFDGLSLT